jgi:hypothetical protein
VRPGSNDRDLTSRVDRGAPVLQAFDVGACGALAEFVRLLAVDPLEFFLEFFLGEPDFAGDGFYEFQFARGRHFCRLSVRFCPRSCKLDRRIHNPTSVSAELVIATELCALAERGEGAPGVRGNHTDPVAGIDLDVGLVRPQVRVGTLTRRCRSTDRHVTSPC